MNTYYFTSESVTEGHPDKLCDTISDCILDEYLKQDENARVAVETFASGNKITIAGQVTAKGEVDIESTKYEQIVNKYGEMESRKLLGDIAKKREWYKRIDKGEILGDIIREYYDLFDSNKDIIKKLEQVKEWSYES